MGTSRAVPMDPVPEDAGRGRILGRMRVGTARPGRRTRRPGAAAPEAIHPSKVVGSRVLIQMGPELDPTRDATLGDVPRGAEAQWR